MCPRHILIYNINDLYTKSIKKATKCIKMYKKNGIQQSVEKVNILALGGWFDVMV